MAAVAITHTIKLFSAAPLPGVSVTARLNVSAFRSDDSDLASVQAYTSDSAGLVTMSLEKNSDVVPADPAVVAADTYYIVEVLLPAKFGGPKQYTIRATVAQTLHDSLVVV